MTDDRPDPARQLAASRNTALDALRGAVAVQKDASAAHEHSAELLSRLGDADLADRARADADRARAWQRRAGRLLSRATKADGLLQLHTLAEPPRPD